MKSFRILKLSLALLSYGFLITQAFGLFSPRFEPLNESDLQIQQGIVDPEADIEYIVSDTDYDDTDSGTDVEYYLKLKVFTERGVDELDKIDLLYTKNSKIGAFFAKISYPNGTSKELNRKDLFDRTIIKSGGYESKVKSFPLPNLVPGCIVEYKYTSYRRYWDTNLMIFFAQEYPIQKVILLVRANTYYASKINYFNMDGEFEKISSGKFQMFMTNVEASKTEPDSPPRTQHEPWIYLRYFNLLPKDNESYWADRAEHLFKESKKYGNPKNKIVRKLAEELFAGITDDEKKIQIAYEYCTQTLKNTSSVTAGYTETEKEDLKENDYPRQTIKNGYGTPKNIRHVFLSLVKAAGVEAFMVNLEDRGYLPFSYGLVGGISLWNTAVAVKFGDSWKLYNPGKEYLPCSWMDHTNMDGYALIGNNKKEANFIKTVALPANKSQIVRKSNFTISEDGQLTGSVDMVYSGYYAVFHKRTLDHKTDSEHEERYKDAIQLGYPRAVLSNFKVENVSSWTEDLRVSYDLTIPNFAEVLGSRLFFEPNIFMAGRKPKYEDESRKTDLFYYYKYQTKESIIYNLPENYKPEEAASPGKPIKANIIEYKSTIGFNKSKTKLQYKRNFLLNSVSIPAKHYEQIKVLFDEINRQDHFSIGLKKTESK